MRKLKYAGAFAILAAVVLLGGWWLGYSQNGRQNLKSDLNLYSRILESVLRNYVEEPNSHELIESSINGMLGSLDPMCELMDPEEYNELMVGTRGKYGGLGIWITIRDEVLTVVSPLKDTPAERIGIQSGDRIVKIEGESTEGITLKEAVNTLRGDPGTKVTITIEREGLDELIDYTLTREVITVDNIPFYELLEGDIGYIPLVHFSEGAGENLEDAVQELVGMGAKKLILDIRNNHGGLLTEAVRVTENFLPVGKTIVSTRGRIQASNKEFKSLREPSFGDYPLVILVNGGSASASEILAGAIQDWDRGLVMGDTTFGKGAVQTTLPVGDGYVLKLTTAKYYTPSGRCIHKGEELAESPDSVYRTIGNLQREVTGGGGIIPDLVVEPGKYSAFETDLLRRDVFQKFASRYAVAHPELPRPVVVDASAVGEFAAYLTDEEIAYSDEDLDKSREFVMRRIEEEISLKLYGREEAYRVALKHDKIVEKAKELLSKASSREDVFSLASGS